jgi:lipopolysaccharide export LptBFGC system permease protein LptF
VIVIVLAIPYALKSAGHARAQNFSYALALAFLYWGVMSICQSFGEHGQMPAWLSAWTANFAFLILALWKLARLA